MCKLYVYTYVSIFSKLLHFLFVSPSAGVFLSLFAKEKKNIFFDHSIVVYVVSLQQLRDIIHIDIHIYTMLYMHKCTYIFSF